MRWNILAIILATGCASEIALGQERFSLEREAVDRYCKGMITEFNFPDGTRVDCINDTHVIEVEFSHKWAEAIGQALHYSLWTAEIAAHPDDFGRWRRQVPTPRRPAILFLCHEDRRLETCADHVVRPLRIAEEFGLPLTIWDCDPSQDMSLSDCQRLDVGGSRPPVAATQAAP
jgi:hypothetical protein